MGLIGDVNSGCPTQTLNDQALGIGLQGCGDSLLEGNSAASCENYNDDSYAGHTSYIEGPYGNIFEKLTPLYVWVNRAICGNGVKEGGEECDDGNAAAGDGCSAGCDLEVLKCSCKVSIDGVVLLDEIPVDEDPSGLTPYVRANSKYYSSTTHILVDNLIMISNGVTVLSEPFDTFASWHVQSKGAFGSTGLSGGALMLGSDHQIVKYNSSIGSFGAGSFSSTFDLYSGPNSAFFQVGPFIIISFAKHMDAKGTEWNTPSIRACGHIVSLPKIQDGWHDVSVEIVRPENGQCQ